MVNFKRFLKHFMYQPCAVIDKVKTLENAMHEAITQSEEKHGCEIVFVIEGALSLAWIFASIERRADYMFKKMNLHKLSSNKGILIYLQSLDNQLEIRVGNGVKVPTEVLNTIIEDGLKDINHYGMHVGCLKIVDKITDELVKHEADNNLGMNEIANNVVYLNRSK